MFLLITHREVVSEEMKSIDRAFIGDTYVTDAIINCVYKFVLFNTSDSAYLSK